MTNTQHTSSPYNSDKKSRFSGRRPSVALVLAFVALLAALSNGAYAVSTAQKNSVTSKSIKNLAVKAADLAPGSVKTPKLANGAVATTKLKDGAVTSPKIADGSIQTNDLANGAVGGEALGTIITVSADSPETADADGINNGGAHGVATASVSCPAGSVTIGGGAGWVVPILADDNKNNYLKSSRRTATGWSASGIVDFGAQGTIKLRTYAYCLVANTN